MKRSRLSYDAWKCIVSKEMSGREIHTEWLEGYIGLIAIKEVSEAQIWKFRGEDIVVCDRGRQWLVVLPRDDWYCMTAMMDADRRVLVWYIDMIAAQGMDADGVPYFDDLYLDLIVYPDGTVIEDDRDELEEALATQDITREQFDLAVETGRRLRQGMLSDISALTEFTGKCYEAVKANHNRNDGLPAK